MRKFIRSDSPDFLKNKWKIWGKRYKNKREKKSGFTFQWPTFQNKKINTLLEHVLNEQTNGHCSYCDTFPDKGKEYSIDHFKPKSKPEFYDIVCQWENLYICCHRCQQSKLEQYNQFLLRPDEEKFSFDYYFIYSYNSNEINPNPTLSEKEKSKAKTTIEIFKLNDKGLVAARRHCLDRYNTKKRLNENIEINDFPYRFTIFE